MGRSNYLALPRMGRSNYVALPRMGRANYLALPRMGRSNYMALPRMGRAYLALPRMGRAQGGDDVSQADVECCMTGLKTEWLLAEDGKTTTQDVCQAESCCSGLQQLLFQRPDGAYYTLCVPAVAEDSKPTQAEDPVVAKLKELLRK